MASSPSSYWGFIISVFVVIILTNIVFFAIYSADKCLVTRQVPVEGQTDPTNTTAQTTSGTSLVLMPLFIALFYLVLCVIAVIIMVGYGNFAGQLWMKYTGYKFLKKILSCFTKSCPSLLKILHIVVFFIILFQWNLILLDPSCDKAVHLTGTGFVIGEMKAQAPLFHAITTIFWVILQYASALFRQNVYWENFAYEPMDPSMSKVGVLVLRKFGP